MATLDETLKPDTQTIAEQRTQTDAPEFSQAPWPLWLRIVFRFVFSYWVLYNLPFPLNRIPGFGDNYFPGVAYLIEGYERLWHVFVPWVGAHILHLKTPITYFMTGSGDTTSEYVRLLCIVVLAAIATVVWTLLDRKHKQYRGLYEGLRIYVRYALAFILFDYGFAKWFYGQFVPPSLYRLAEPYGDFSPMGVLWASIGVSFPYMWFTGLVEISGGVLLLFRRTMTLGALISAAAMLEVAMLNYGYDVPVKLFSTNLFLMAVFLLVPDVRRLINMFLLNRTATPANIAFPWKRRWMRPTRIVIKTFVIATVLYGTTFGLIHTMSKYRGAIKRSPLYGIYNVEASAQSTAQPGDDALRWRTVVFESPSGAYVFTMDDSHWFFSTRFDEAKKQFVVLSGRDLALETRPNAPKKKPTVIGTLTYDRPDGNHLHLQGTLMNEPVDLRLRKVDDSKYLLLNRGYHWITEISFNR
jgi:uncharacterized membrane protein YphA (DoxX/SURF4 family)